MNYFDHPYISNSDLKSFRRQAGLDAGEQPENLQAIFDLGTLIHETILQPHLADKSHPDLDLALRMRKTFFKDEMCRNFVMASDFEREKEFYKEIEVGGMKIKARCKADGVRTRMRWFMELKGMGLTTEKQFLEALDRFHYDMGIALYMLTSECPLAPIVTISKKDPDKMFKKIVKQHDELYLSGEQKLIDTLTLLHSFSPDDVKLVA